MNDQTYKQIVQAAAIGLLSVTLADIREHPAGGKADLRLVWDKAKTSEASERIERGVAVKSAESPAAVSAPGGTPEGDGTGKA